MGYFFSPYKRETENEVEFNALSAGLEFKWEFDGDVVRCKVEENDIENQRSLILRLDTNHPIAWYKWSELNQKIGKDITFD